MTTTHPTNPRRTILIAGVILLLFATYLLAFLLPDFIRTAVGPKQLTMAQAAETASETDAYIAISDGAWECDTIEYVRGRSSTNSLRETTRFTEVFRTNGNGMVVLLATMSGEVDCAELQATDLAGYLQRMSPEREQELINEVRLARFINATVFLEICGYCGPTNSLIGTMFGFGFGLIGLVLLVWGLRMQPH
jgi:hypothetical protein